jgi:D-alanyl-D-alanine dipeptidase
LRGPLGSQTAALHRCANPVGVCLAALVWLVGVPAAGAQEMPNRFMYLHDVDPTLLQDMRYASANNFTGHVVPGYAAPECLLVREAADALKAVQAELTPQGLSLKVYDCYRPARAVAAFVAWAKEPDDPHAKAVHYPALDKAALLPGYIATRSGHSRGATVDLTLVPLSPSAEVPAADASVDAPCTAPRAARAADASLDMGTSFDCFDAKANTLAAGLTETQQANRALLLDAMARHRFKNYDKEWWHFMLEDEPYPGTIFDFPILPREKD